MIKTFVGTSSATPHQAALNVEEEFNKWQDQGYIVQSQSSCSFYDETADKYVFSLTVIADPSVAMVFEAHGGQL